MTAPRTGPGDCVDVCRALDLLAEIGREGGHDGDEFFREVFSRAGVVDDDLDTLQGKRLIDLYVSQQLSIAITLGAALVLDAAQRAQDQGRGWGEALAAAQAAVGRFLDLVPARLIRSIAVECA